MKIKDHLLLAQLTLSERNYNFLIDILLKFPVRVTCDYNVKDFTLSFRGGKRLHVEDFEILWIFNTVYRPVKNISLQFYYKTGESIIKDQSDDAQFIIDFLRTHFYLSHDKGNSWHHKYSKEKHLRKNINDDTCTVYLKTRNPFDKIPKNLR